MKNKKNMKKNKLDPIGNLVRYGSFSAKWTALFAFIALFSVMVLGITQVSFAAGPVDYPDQLTDSSISQTSDFTWDWIPTGQIKLKYAHANIDGKDELVPVYCLEEWKQFGDHYNYNKIDDKTYLTPGVVAILSYANSGMWGKNLADDINGTKREQAITQLAVWAYLYTHDVDGYKSNATDMASVIDQMMQNSEIAKLVQYGEDNDQGCANPTVSISQPNGDFQLSDDQQYMISQEMTVIINSSETLQSFKLNLEGAPDGTMIIVNDSEEYTVDQLANHEFGLNDLGMKVRVKVPKDKLTEESKTFTLRASIVTACYEGWEYEQEGSAAAKAQRIAAGHIVNHYTDNPVTLSVSYKVDVPDTAQNNSAMLYLTGLIVLLCGVGVIYVNVKAAKQKQ